MFRLGRVKDGARGPGLIFIVPLVDRVHRVSLRIVTMPIQSQGIITRDNVSVDVSAVAYYRVADAVRSVVAIENVVRGDQPDRADHAARRRRAPHARRDAVRDRHDQPEHPRDPRRPDRGVGRPGHGRRAQGHPAAREHAARDGPPGRGRAREARQDHRRRGRGARRRRARPRASDVMMAHPLALQLRNLQTLVEISRRQELDRRLPGAADEHDPGARRLPQPRDRSGRRPTRPARRGGAAQRRASSTLTSRRVAPRTRLGERRVRGVRVWISPRTGPRIADPGSAGAVVRLIRGLVACLGPDPAPSP